MSERKVIALVGAGNIGSRHLQALANVDTPLQIYVIDPNKDSLSLADERFRQIDNSDVHNVIFGENIDIIPKAVDMAIIATSSGPRLNIITEFLSKTECKKMVLEKFLFNREEDFYRAREVLKKYNVSVWVNTTYRAIPFYKKLAEHLSDARYLNMLVTGGKWGLACNGIHYLDLYNMLLADSEELEARNSGLDNVIYKSKRDGYIEFNGTVSFVGSKGSLTLTCIHDSDCPMITSIHSDKGFFEIIESNDECRYRIAEDGYELKSCEVGNLPTSVAMIGIYSDILDYGKCDLPVFDISMKAHLVFLKTLLEKENMITGDLENDVCQIT